MNGKAYERACLIRRPDFRLDFKKLLDENQKILEMYAWRASRGATPIPPAIGPAESDPEMRALQAFKERYPTFDSHDEISSVFVSYPLVFDPAWKVAVDQALGRLNGPTPKGLVTRIGLDEPVDTSETREVYRVANRIFDETDERLIKKGWRQIFSEAIFRSSRLFLPIGPETNLEQIQRLWPVLQKAQRACYGEPRRRRAAREGIHEERIKVWDLVREKKLSRKVAIERSGLTERSFWRRYAEARRDIANETQLRIGPDEFASHLEGCSKCQEAERVGKSDYFCPWMQKQVGRRSALEKGTRVELDKVERENAKSRSRQRAEDT